METVWVVGVGMTRFAKSDRSLRSLAVEATAAAVEDAEMQAGDIEAAFVGNGAAGLVTGQEMIKGQLMLRGAGIEGIPIFNIENACASASSALHLGWQAVASEMHDVVLCLGAEKLTHEDKTVGMRAISAAADVELLAERAAALGAEDAEDAAKRSYFMDVYAELTRAYMARSGATAEDFAAVAVKNQHNGGLNPRAQYGGDFTIEEILASRTIVEPLHLLMCSPISDGAAAVVLMSDAAKRRFGRPGARIRASVVVSGSRHDDSDPLAGSTGRAAAAAFEEAELEPTEIDFAELHDASAPAELMLYEQVGFASAGEGPALLASGKTALAGSMPVNASGGLLSKGHPIGATGLAQICELTWQLRGDAGARQVEGAKVGLAQNGGGWIEGDSAAMAVHILSSK